MSEMVWNFMVRHAFVTDVPDPSPDDVENAVVSARNLIAIARTPQTPRPRTARRADREEMWRALTALLAAHAADRADVIEYRSRIGGLMRWDDVEGWIRTRAARDRRHGAPPTADLAFTVPGDEWVRRVRVRPGGELAPLYQVSLGLSLAYGWEEAHNVFAKEYAAGNVPGDDQILQDLSDFMPLLAQLYEAVAIAPTGTRRVHTPTDPVIRDITKRTRGRSQGRELDAETRVAIEKYAEDVAEAALESDWTVTRVGDLHLGYDLDCVNGSDALHVEVKGTRTLGEEVTLTGNEVRHHPEHGGNCPALHALFVVSEVKATATRPVQCSGGVSLYLRDWVPAPSALTPTEYAYRVPRGDG